MWGLVLVGIVMAYPTNKTTGSLELRFDTKEECMAAKEVFDKNGQFKKSRVMTSCTYRGYLL